MLATIVAAACGGKSPGPTDGGNDHPAEGGGTKSNGTSCGQGSECLSGFCTDGVCCNESCSAACHTCAATGHAGTCTASDMGTNPRGMCGDTGAANCGTNGQCDGAGNCQMYASGTMCATPGCTGSTLTTAGRCDGEGTCAGATITSCAPFMCGTNGQCATTCTADNQCVSPATCNTSTSSCGKKPPGAACASDDDCNSGTCAQGVCCMTACSGTCKSCAVAGSAGTCTNVPAGQDPLEQCADSGATSCGNDGFCDGKGACELYSTATVCGTASCTAGTGTIAGKCDGMGTCLPGTLQDCRPYICGASACSTACAADTDCAPNYFCTGTICAKKTRGMTCAAAADCDSGYCEQGVCCNTGCEATCVSCNLTGTVGTCVAVPAGQAPATTSQCPMAAPTSCGNDGLCDGAGQCEQYSAGLPCASESCMGSTLSASRTCDGAGLCREGPSASCAPFACGSSGSCATSCSTSNDCASPATCTSMSCGKKPPGATCGTSDDCASGFCVQGVCCNTACTGLCTSCTLQGSVGICTNVPAGQKPTPASQCTDAGATTCKTDGTCDGNGGCRNYGAGVLCAAATCTNPTGAAMTASYTTPAACDGMGTCQMPTSGSCGKYACNPGSNVCRSSCTVDSDCVSPYVCNAGACSLKPLGRTCAAGSDCASGFCAQGVCCASSCSGTCQSCALSGSQGTCTSVPAGQAPAASGQCSDGGAAACGQNGMCDGTGKCQLYSNGTVCAAGSCTGSTLTPARTCDGAGSCKTVSSSICDPFTCDSGARACKTTCSADTDCVSPRKCSSGSCGGMSLGTACTTGGQCNSGICQQGVCCATTCTSACNSCAVAGKLGTCSAVPAGGADPTSSCAMSDPSTCGLTGSCDGAGACQKYAAGTACAAASCAGTTLTPASTCNGTGTCTPASNSSCTPYQCGTGACKTACSTDADCVSNFHCLGSTCSSGTTLTVKLQSSSSATNQWIQPVLQFTNGGMTAVPFSDLTIRYWYTYDTTPVVAESSMCNYFQTTPPSTATCANVNGNFAALATPVTGADSYYEISFATAAGSLAPGVTAELGVGFHKNDWSNFTQTNDYSYNGAMTFTTTTKVTVYRLGTLVYGAEPM